MTGYDASVLNNPKARILIVAPNWLGDGIMAMPAVQELRSHLHPDAKILVAARPGQTGLWEMQPAVSDVIRLPSKTSKLLHSAKLLTSLGCTHAIVLPHSFRSALLCALARIPHRRGTTFQTGRPFLIQDAVNVDELETKHQQWEIAKLLLPLPLPKALPLPHIEPSKEAMNEAENLISALPRPLLGCIPGAARGPSKQWPGDRFQAVAEAWIHQTGGSVCWLGTPADVRLCQSLNTPLDERGVTLAGKTSLSVFTALLQKMDQALVNDSGGMHLAAAVGTPLVAIFGTTDPAKTGPLSKDAVVLQKSDLKNRSIDRKSVAAQEALARITVEEVLEPTLAKHI